MSIHAADLHDNETPSDKNLPNTRMQEIVNDFAKNRRNSLKKHSLVLCPIPEADEQNQEPIRQPDQSNENVMNTSGFSTQPARFNYRMGSPTKAGSSSANPKQALTPLNLTFLATNRPAARRIDTNTPSSSN